MMVGTEDLTRKVKYENLRTNTKDKSQIITEECHYANASDYSQLAGKPSSKCSQFKVNLFNNNQQKEGNIPNGHLLPAADDNEDDINNNNDDNSKAKQYSIIKTHSKYSTETYSHLHTLQRLSTLSCLNSEIIQLVMPSVFELLQIDELRSNQELFERLKTIHSCMQEVISSNNPKHMLLLSMNDRQTIYDCLLAISLVDKEAFQKSALAVWPNSKLTETLNTLQYARDNLFLSIPENHTVNVNNNNNSYGIIIKPQEFNQIKRTLLEIIKKDEKMSFSQYKQYMSDSIEEAINSLEQIDPTISFQRNSQVNLDIIQHLDNIISLNHGLIVNHGIEAVRQSVQSEIQSDQCVLKRQAAIDIVTALKLVEDEYDNSVTTAMTSDNNTQNTPNIDHLKCIHRCIMKQLSEKETDNFINQNIICQSSDITLLKKAFTNYLIKINCCLKAFQQKESLVFENIGPRISQITYENTPTRFQHILTPISEHCTPETSLYETDTISNDSIVKSNLIFKKQHLNNILNEMNHNITVCSKEENKGILVSCNTTLRNISESMRSELPDLSTYIDETQSKHDDSCTVSDLNASYITVSNQFESERNFFVDSSVIAPIVSYLKSKLLENTGNNFIMVDDSYSPRTLKDVKQVSNYLVQCLNANSEKPVKLTSAYIDLLNRLFSADQSTYSCILKKQLDSCINLKETSNSDFASENLSVVNEELSSLINNITENEDIITNKAFVEKLCSAVTKYRLPILPEKYPCLSNIISNPNHIKLILNSSPLFKPQLSDELKQFLEVLQIELQSENIVYNDSLVKQPFHFPITTNSLSEKSNDESLSSRPTMFIQTMISLYILDLFCSLPDEINKLIYLLSIRQNFQSLVDFCESPSMHCSPICMKLKSLLNLSILSHQNELPDKTVAGDTNGSVSVTQMFNNMLPSIQVTVNATKTSKTYQNQFHNLLIQTRNKVINKRYYFVNGETDDITCGILITLTSVFITGLETMSPYEIAKIIGKFTEFYHALINSKFAKISEDTSTSVVSFLSSGLCNDSLSKYHYRRDQMNLTDLNRSIYRAASDCLSELSMYERMAFLNPLVLLGILLSQRRLHYNLIDLTSTEANILISILLLFRSKFYINLQTTLTNITKKLMKAIQNTSPTLLPYKLNYISLGFSPHFTSVPDLCLVKQKLQNNREKALVPYVSSTNQLNHHLETCNITSSDITIEKPVEYNHTKDEIITETFVNHNLHLHILMLEEILSQSTTEGLSCALKIKPQNCKFLINCLSDIVSCPILIPTDMVKLTQQIIQEIHSKKFSNSYEISEETSTKFITYFKSLSNKLKEKYIKLENGKIINPTEFQTVENDDSVDSIHDIVNLNTVFAVAENKIRPTTWFAIRYQREVTNKFISLEGCLMNEKNDLEILHNSTNFNNFSDQIILLTHLNKLKVIFESTNQSEFCLLDAQNTEMLLCMLEIIKNQTDIMEALKLDQEFLSLFKLNVIQSCINSTPFIINSKTKLKLQNILEKLCYTQRGNIENMISDYFKDLCLSNDIQFSSRSLNNLILGQVALLAYSKQLNLSNVHADSLYEYCLSYQNSENMDASCEQIISFTNFLSNIINISDVLNQESLTNNNTLYSKLEIYKEFYNRIRTSKVIVNSTSAYEILFRTIELEHLSRLYSFQIQCIPESLKCSLISMLAFGEQFFPFTLKVEEQMHLDCIAEQLNNMTNAITNTHTAADPIALMTADEHPIISGNTEKCEATLLVPNVNSQHVLMNTNASLVSKESTLKIAESHSDPEFHDILLSSELNVAQNKEEFMISAIRKIIDIYNNSSKSHTSDIIKNSELKLSESIKMANLFHEVYSNEQLMDQLTTNEIQNINDIYFKLTPNNFISQIANTSELLKPENMTKQKILPNLKLYTSETDSEIQDILDADIKNSDYIISVMSSQQSEDSDEQIPTDKFSTKSTVGEQDIDIKTASILISTIQSYLKLKPLTTIQIIPLFSLLENINSQLEILDIQDVSSYPTIKLSSSDLKPLATISTSIKSQISQETMTSCTDLLNYKILFDIISCNTSIWKTESAIAYSALHGLLSSTTTPSKSCSNDLCLSFINDEKVLFILEQRLLHYYYYYSLEEKQSFILTDSEIRSCKILLQTHEFQIKSRILQKIKKAQHLVNQSNEYNCELDEEVSFFQDIYYLILICLPNLITDNAEFLQMLINLLVIHRFICDSKNFAHCLKIIFNSYDVLDIFEKQSCLQNFFEIQSSSLASSKHYMILFSKILDRFVNSGIFNRSFSSVDISLLVSLLQRIQSYISSDVELSFHLKHLISRLLYVFVTDQNIFIDKHSKLLINDLCEHLKSISMILQEYISTEGSKFLDIINKQNECNQSDYYQPIVRSLETVLFNPTELSTEPLRAKQIAYIVKNLNRSGDWLLKQSFIAQPIGNSLNILCNADKHENTSFANLSIIFQCIQVMENHLNKNIMEPSVSHMINKEDAAALSTSLSWFLSGNLDFLSDIVDNALEENVFINSPESWTNLMLLEMWYTSIACARPFYHISQQTHSKLIKLAKLEINRLTEFWKPRLDLYSQKQRTVIIQKLSVSTECDLTAEVTNQELKNAIQLSLLSGRLNGPRSAWICVNVLNELQNECEHEFVSISNSEKEALRYALCSNTTISSCELIPNTDIIASVVYLNSFLSKLSSLPSSENPELFLIQPTDAAPLASSIQNILKFIHPDVHKPLALHSLSEIESYLWISSANLEASWISNFESCLIDEYNKKALQIVFRNVQSELINLLNEFDEENFIKPNLIQIPIEPINRKNLSQLLRVSILLNQYPVKHTITMLNHFQHLHDISCSVLPVQTISYLRYFVSCILTNKYNNHLQNSYHETSTDITSLTNSCTIDRLDSSLINCFLYVDISNLNLPQDCMPIIQAILIYYNTCEELVQFLNILPKHCRQHLISYLFQLFCINLHKYTTSLLKVIKNEEEFEELDINTHQSIPLLLHFLKHLIPKDIKKQNKHNEFLSVATMSTDVKSQSHIFEQSLERLLSVNLNDLSSCDLIQLIIDSDQLHHNLTFSKIFHEDLEYIPHLKYYLCSSLIRKLCSYSHLSIEESFPQTSLSISYEEISIKLKNNINKIFNNLSLDNDQTKICSLNSGLIESINGMDEIKSDIISDNLTNFSSCEDLLYPIEDVRPEINRLNHLLTINSLQPNEMSAILSSIVILRDASIHLPSDLKDYARFSMKEENALNKLQMLIDQKTIGKLDRQLKHTLLLLSQRLGLLAIQANKDLLRTGLEIWLNASLENELIFTKQQTQQIYYAMYLAEQINNQEYTLQNNFCNTFDLVEQVILQLKPLVTSKFGAKIEGPHSLCPIVTLFLEHALQLLEHVTYSCKVSTNGIPDNSFDKQHSTAENLWNLISRQSPEIIEDELSSPIQTLLNDSFEDQTDAAKFSKQTNNKPSQRLKRHPKIDECNTPEIRQCYNSSLNYGKNDYFQLNNHVLFNNSLSLLALYDEEKRRLLSWEEMTETRLRKACERVENLLRVIPEHIHLQDNPDHTVTQLKEEIVLLKGQLHTMMKQKILKRDYLIHSNRSSSVLNKNEQGEYLFDSSLYTQENQFDLQEKLNFDYIQLSERDSRRKKASLNCRLSSSTCSLKTFQSLSKRIYQSHLVSCKPVTPDYVCTSPPNIDKRILQNSFDRLHELIEIRRAVVAGSREELRRLGIHSSLSAACCKPFALTRPRDNRSFILPSTSSHVEWLSSSQQNINRKRIYTTHLFRSADEYSRSNQVIEDLENKLGQLEEQILPHRSNGSVVHSIMASGLITLIAENQSFQVPRDVLTKSSLYFSAAFESGMTESKTSQFSFPNFTAHQLAMVVQFLRPELTTRSDALNNHTNILNNSCPEILKILEALDLADAADYFQMPKLIQTCVQRISHIMNELFQPKSIQLHESHNCDIFSIILKEFAKVFHRENCCVNKLFSEYTLRYPHFILRPCLSDPNLQHLLINLVISYLSKSVLCIPDEDIVLNIVLSWLRILKPTQFYTENTVQCFLQCVRPGLLSLDGQVKLLDYWRKQHPELRWFGKLTCEDMEVFFKTIPNGGIFYKSPLASQLQVLLLKPRAESLCLLGLAPSRSSNSLEFWLFNLHNGAYHNYPILDNCLRELGLDSSGVGDIDHRIYFCPVTYGPSSYQSNLFVMCFDPNNARLSGFAWCLASCRAKLIPRLLLSPTNNRNSSVNPFCSRSRRIGLTTLSNGLYMYYLSSIQEVTWLCAFRFDLSSWNWYGMEPYCLSRSQNGIVLFTPIEQLNPIPPDDWVYANIETVSSSNNSRHPRHGLHQTSSLRSQFFRFRPRSDKNALIVENLPNPPFLIRMYRLLAISCSVESNFSDYLDSLH
ncbi:unnamed protein product [Schistosoma turkestanicum]|nr:unnamed protein product [Schistosoma turkestanicum]